MNLLGSIFRSPTDKSKTAPPPAPKPSPEKSQNSEKLAMVAVIAESERFVIDKGWSYENLTENDPLRFKSSAGESGTFPNPPLAQGWSYDGTWEVERYVGDDIPKNWDAEWVYATSFDELEKGNISHIWHGALVVRRKKWIRVVKPTTQTAANTFKLAADSMKRMTVNDNKETVDKADDWDSQDKESDKESSNSVGGDNVSVGGDIKFEFEDDHDEIKSVVDSQFDESESGRSRRASFSSAFRRYSGNTTSSATTNTATGSTAAASKPFNWNMRDSQIQAIGKKIKAIESDIKSTTESDLSDWSKYNKPALTIQIRELEKVCEQLKTSIEQSVGKGLEYISKLEDDLKNYSTRLEEVKKKYYFPASPITLGQSGIYIGLDDIWLEKASGYYEVELTPNKDRPQIQIVVTGNKVTQTGRNGMAVRLQADGFKIAGDKGKRIPKIGLETIKVTLELKIVIVLHYDHKTAKWIITEVGNFQIELLSFKGPYGMNKSVVGTILSMINPLIKSKLLAALPPELGLFMRTLPSPISIRGEFDISGPELSLLTIPLEQSELLCQSFDYSAFQMEMFKYLQRLLERSKPIRSIKELLEYIKYHSKNKEGWVALVALWNQAAKLFSDKVYQLKVEQFPNDDSLTPAANQISFNNFLTSSEDFRKKRMVSHFKLHYLDGQLSLNSLLRYGYQLYHRVSSEEFIKPGVDLLRKARLMLVLSRMQTEYEAGLKLIKMVSRNFDFGQLKIQASLNAGPQGKISLTARDILAQMPLVLSFNLQKEKNLGHAPIVPYVISLKPHETGDIDVEIYHYSKEGIDLTNSLDSHRHPQGEESQSSATTGITQLASIAHSSIEHIKKNVTHKLTEGLNILDSAAVNAAASVASWSSTSSTTHTSTHRTYSRSKMNVDSKRSKQLQETLSQMPQGLTADVILVTTISKPHISLVVDKAVTLKPGAEIFTVMLGPREDWKPFGTENTVEDSQQMESEYVDSDSEEELSFPMPPSEHMTELTPDVLEEARAAEKKQARRRRASSTSDAGCPVLVQTSPGIKILQEIPKAEVSINLPSLVRFVSSHFDDIELLKKFLEKFAGGEVFSEHLQVIKLILDRLAKYLLLPGLDFDVNINGKIVALNNEIIISVETPEFVSSSMSSEPIMMSAAAHRRPSILLNSKAVVKPEDICAMSFRAEINLIDILEDTLAVEQSLRSFE